MPNVYNKPTAAKALGISVETLDRYRKKGKLPYHSVGDRILFTDKDLADFLDSCAIPPTDIPTGREKSEMSKAVPPEEDRDENTPRNSGEV